MLSDRIKNFLEISRKLTAGRFELLAEKSIAQTFHVESTNFTFDLELSEARIHSRIYKKYNLNGSLWDSLLKIFSSTSDTVSNLEILFWIDEKLLTIKQLTNCFNEINQIEIASSIFLIDDKNLLSKNISDILNLTELFSIRACENIKLDEGEEYFTLQKKYERSPLLRKIAIQQHGVNCNVCGFNFEVAYGSLGKGFIHIHHIERLADTGKKLIDPRTDLVPVCPNCHAMLHAKMPPLMPAELKEKIEANNND